LKFPTAEIIGSDLSKESLAMAQRASSELGISNLTLTQESINQANYANEFDYVLCTGVIHHNADPQIPLDRLARSLKTDGVLELMVFNSFHSITTSAMQRVVQLLTGQPSTDHFQIQVETAEQLVKEMNWTELSAGPMTVTYKDASKSQVADLLAQPVWHSFTVDGLEAMSQKSGLDFVAPCLNQFDAAAGSIGWEIDFKDAALRDRYLALPQTKRWQVANLLLMEKSPMLWFYFQRKDSIRPLKSQAQIFDEFLESHGAPANVTKTIWTRNSQGSLNKIENVAHRPSPRDPDAARILSELRPGRTVRNAFDAAGFPINFLACNRIRLQLASAIYPILRLSRSQPVINCGF
jgi:ubiquinone/menaquinone biosynthesis C-methylase UbiE